MNFQRFHRKRHVYFYFEPKFFLKKDTNKSVKILQTVINREANVLRKTTLMIKLTEISHINIRFKWWYISLYTFCIRLYPNAFLSIKI